MLQIPRALARSLRAVLRRCLFDGCARNDWPYLRVCGDARQRILESARGPIALRYILPGNASSGAFAFRTSALAQFEGRTNAPVTLESLSNTQAIARWDDGGVPREQALEAVNPDGLPELPELPASMVAMPEGILEALAEASLTTAWDSGRYALERIQMCGQDGTLVATDGKQLLMQRGFPWPWSDRVLVPRLRLTGLPGVSCDAPVTLGRTDTRVVLQVCEWTFFLRIDDQAKYPEVKDALPRPTSITSRCHLAAEDARRLIEILPKLPGHDVDQKPVTVDLGDAIAVRGRGTPSGPAAEVVLPGSVRSGKPVRFACPRELLLRALRMGLTELEVVRADAPIVFRGTTRVYGWMPLEVSAVVPADQPMVGMHVPEPSLAPPPEPSGSHQTLPEPRSPVMPSPSTNGLPPDERTTDTAGPFAGIDDLLGEAETLRQSLSEAAARAARLVAALKQHRRQARAVEATVSSLRDLRIGSR